MSAAASGETLVHYGRPAQEALPFHCDAEEDIRFAPWCNVVLGLG